MTIKIIPKKGYAEKQAAIVVRYGGADNFHQMPNGSIKEMPEGIAHFLEHKMFEDPDVGMFEEFTKLGASVNAYTHFTHTVYYFNTIDNFYENLSLLFHLIKTPHFTDENVEKEKGIILSEIDMYADNPYWQVYTSLHRALFSKSPLRQDILGTKESVSTIIPMQLYECYNNFYSKDNMSLICVGDLDPKKIAEVVPSAPSRAAPQASQPYHETEPIDAASHYTEKQMSVSIPIFQLGFKAIYEKPANPTTLAASSILADMLAGESSDSYFDLYNQGMIDNHFSAEYIGGTYYGIFLFSGTSASPETVKRRIMQSIRTGLDKNRFETIKSKHIGRYIRSLNSIETISSAQADLFTKGHNIEDMLTAFTQIKLTDVEQQHQTHLHENSMALSTIVPKTKD